MIGDSLFSNKIGIEEITDLSLNILGKLMNEPFSLFHHGVLI